MRLDQVAGVEMEWVQPAAMKRAFTLRSAEHQVASLRFEKGSLATGECDGKTWTFKRTGFLSPKITARAAGSEDDVAVFTAGWGGSGTVVFSWGAHYQLRPTNFWHTEWSFESADGRVAATLAGLPHLFKQGGVATVSESAGSLPETPILVLLMWYVRVLTNEEAGAAVVAAT